MKCGTRPIQLLGYLGRLLFLVPDEVDPIMPHTPWIDLNFELSATGKLARNGLRRSRAD